MPIKGVTPSNFFKKLFLFLFVFIFSSQSAFAYKIVVEQPAGSASALGDLISKGITAAIVLAALITFLYLVWGGIEWLTSGGDKEKYESARNRITAAIIGLAIVIAAYAVMQLIAHFFGFDLSDLKLPQIETGSTTSEFPATGR